LGVKLRNTLISSLEETLSDASSAVPAMFRKVVKSQAPQESETSQRLASLEHQVASLRDRSLNIGITGARSSTSFASSNFKKKIVRATSREEAVEVTREAIINGVPLKYIQDITKRYLGGTEAAEVFNAANRSLFSGS
jgi:hypothetical protein